MFFDRVSVGVDNNSCLGRGISVGGPIQRKTEGDLGKSGREGQGIR